MQEIRNCANKLVCMGDARTGKIEAVYRKQRIQTILPIGFVFTIELDGIITYVLRVSSTEFAVTSHYLVA